MHGRHRSRRPAAPRARRRRTGRAGPAAARRSSGRWTRSPRSIAPLHAAGRPGDLLAQRRPGHHRARAVPSAGRTAPCRCGCGATSCAPDPALASYFPLVLRQPRVPAWSSSARAGRPRGGDCFGWAGGGSRSCARSRRSRRIVDLLATMIELREFVHHSELGVIEFDPGPRWPDAQAVRLAAGRAGRRAVVVGTSTTVADLLARAEGGESPSGAIRARVVALAGCASGQRIEVSDGTGRLDLWCPATLCGSGPMIDRQFEFQVTRAPGLPAAGRPVSRAQPGRAGHPRRRPACCRDPRHTRCTTSSSARRRRPRPPRSAPATEARPTPGRRSLLVAHGPALVARRSLLGARCSALTARRSRAPRDSARCHGRCS